MDIDGLRNIGVLQSPLSPEARPTDTMAIAAVAGQWSGLGQWRVKTVLFRLRASRVGGDIILAYRSVFLILCLWSNSSMFLLSLFCHWFLVWHWSSDWRVGASVPYCFYFTRPRCSSRIWVFFPHCHPCTLCPVLGCCGFLFCPPRGGLLGRSCCFLFSSLLLTCLHLPISGYFQWDFGLLYALQYPVFLFVAVS